MCSSIHVQWHCNLCLVLRFHILCTFSCSSRISKSLHSQFIFLVFIQILEDSPGGLSLPGWMLQANLARSVFARPGLFAITQQISQHLASRGGWYKKVRVKTQELSFCT